MAARVAVMRRKVTERARNRRGRRPSNTLYEAAGQLQSAY